MIKMDELNRDEFVENDFEHLKIYFDQSDWNELSVYEKQRFARIKRNYENLVEMGVNPAVPPFMVKKKRVEIATCSQTDSRKSVKKNSKCDRGVAPSSSTRKRSYSKTFPEELKSMSKKPTVSRAINSSDFPGDVNEYQISQKSEYCKPISRRISTENDAREKSRFSKRDGMGCLAEDNLVLSGQNKYVRSTAKNRVLRKCHACPHCDYKTKTKNIQRHIAGHEGIRPYKCQLCDYRASRVDSLRKHIDAVHDGKKPYKCQHCDYRASQTSHLKVHIHAVHEGKKSHSCPHCDYRAAHSCHVRRHVKTVHERMKPYGCRICDYRTSDNSNLRKHLKAMHGGKENIAVTKV